MNLYFIMDSADLTLSAADISQPAVVNTLQSRVSTQLHTTTQENIEKAQELSLNNSKTKHELDLNRERVKRFRERKKEKSAIDLSQNYNSHLPRNNDAISLDSRV